MRKYENLKIDNANLKLEMAEAVIQKISSEQAKRQSTAQATASSNRAAEYLILLNRTNAKNGTDENQK